MKKVVIVDYARTAFSRARPRDPQQDPWYQLTAEDLLARATAATLERSAIGPGEVDNFLVGCALGVGEQWTFGGRTSALLAGLSPTVPARFIDMQCGSGMATIESAFFELACGQAEVVLATGMEHMTRMPIGPKLYELGYVKVNPKVYRQTAEWDMVTGLNMGLTAELLAAKYDFDRHQLDEFAVRSHQLAAAAENRHYFADEIVPVFHQDKKNSLLSRDQNIRPDTSLEHLAQLKPAFKEDGVITAGNSSPLSSGAAAMLVLAEEAAQNRGLQPVAEILATGIAGVRPEWMGTGPLPAIQKALYHADLSVRDIDLWEINEAFSVVVLHAAKELGLNLNRINIFGGALALGHPLGATGIRLVGTLARGLRETGQRYGCAAACIGGGQGIAVILKTC